MPLLMHLYSLARTEENKGRGRHSDHGSAATTHRRLHGPAHRSCWRRVCCFPFSPFALPRDLSLSGKFNQDPLCLKVDCRVFGMGGNGGTGGSFVKIAAHVGHLGFLTAQVFAHFSGTHTVVCTRVSLFLSVSFMLAGIAFLPFSMRIYSSK